MVLHEEEYFINYRLLVYHYSFPRITSIDDVLPAIKDKPEFIVAERDHYNVVNYIVSTSDTFPEPLTEPDRILRECRGIIFGKDGKVIARRLHKFFNVNEREETQMHSIDLSRPHKLLEKLDGSMITPIPIGDHIRWGTKMGLTEVAFKAEEFIAKHPEYVAFAEYCIDNGTTPIFEFCSRKQRIVLDYPEERLVLTAVRDNTTGTYYDLAVWCAEFSNIPLVHEYEGTIEGMEQLIEHTSNEEGIEGYVLRFDDGHMIKIKSDWYCRIHKAKDNLIFEKNVIKMVLEGKADDVKAFLLEDDRLRLEKFETALTRGLLDTQERIHRNYEKLYNATGGDRKGFALEFAPSVPILEKPIYFHAWGNANSKEIIGESVIRTVLANTGSQTLVDKVRCFHNAHWDYSVDE
jgi:RNA ligase